MLGLRFKTPQPPTQILIIPVCTTTPHLKTHLLWISKPVSLYSMYLCSPGDSGRRTPCTTVVGVLIGLYIMTMTGRRLTPCITMFGSLDREVIITSLVWDTIILGLDSDVRNWWFLTCLSLYEIWYNDILEL